MLCSDSCIRYYLERLLIVLVNDLSMIIVNNHPLTETKVWHVKPHYTGIIFYVNIVGCGVKYICCYYLKSSSQPGGGGVGLNILCYNSNEIQPVSPLSMCMCHTRSSLNPFIFVLYISESFPSCIKQAHVCFIRHFPKLVQFLKFWQYAYFYGYTIKWSHLTITRHISKLMKHDWKINTFRSTLGKPYVSHCESHQIHW